MKKISDQEIIMLLAFMLTQFSCFANLKDTFNIEKHVVSFWHPKDSVNYHLADVNEKHRLGLIFEQDFDNDVYIYVNDSLVFSNRLKTIPNLSAVDANIDLKYKDTLSTIRIVLKDIGSQIIFNPVVGYRICYINRFNSVWNTEFSNFYRDYH